MPQLGTVYRRLSQQGARGKGAIKKGRRRRKVLQSPRRSGKNEKVARAKPTYSLPLPPLESGAERVYFFFRFSGLA